MTVQLLKNGGCRRIIIDNPLFLIQRIITCYMANEDYPEALKLEIIHAIDDLDTGLNE